MKKSKTARRLSGRSLEARMPRLKSESGCDPIENLGCLLLLAALFLLGGREIGGAEVGLLHIVLLGLLALLLGSREVGDAEVRLLALLLGLLLGGREVGDAEVGLLVLFLGLLLGSRKIGYAEIGLLGLLLGLLFRGGQLIALDDAAGCRCRVRRQAHRGEKAERDSDSGDLAHGVCPLNRSTRMAGAFLSGIGNSELEAFPQTNIL